jgi:hypothetical protein
MSGVAIATRGMVRSCCRQGGFICGDSPEVQAVLEVRPKIRYAAAPPSGDVTSPIMIGAQELRPSAGATGPGPADPDPKPTQTSAQELRPVIKRAEED